MTNNDTLVTSCLKTCRLQIQDREDLSGDISREVLTEHWDAFTILDTIQAGFHRDVARRWADVGGRWWTDR